MNTLRAVTTIPTAAGREWRVVRWIEDWADARDDVILEHDEHGNLVLRLASTRPGRPVYFTAHLDHPAFVVERVVSPTILECAFRGGVMDDYFVDARVRHHASDDHATEGVITEKTASEPDKTFLVDLDHEADASRGDVVTWALPPDEVIDGVYHTNACDDLAAVAAALDAFDRLRAIDERQETRLLFTLAEEVGFIGAIGACRSKTMPMDARVIALENSRAFPEAPIGGGPIVRVGDRLSVFSPTLTNAITKRAEEIGGTQPTAQQKNADGPTRRWQRKLMAGGACEATVFCAYGYEATCVCLPLGNYHNMANLTEVQAGGGTAEIGREHIAVDDYEGLVELLVACGERLPETDPITERLDRLWSEKSGLLHDS
ncbi:MAG: hypothetical protein KDA28_05545 [Phycisphaerales bacterium]|nr:hypothetical protein [Phycisphaerales bacterium]